MHSYVFERQTAHFASNLAKIVSFDWIFSSFLIKNPAVSSPSPKIQGRIRLFVNFFIASTTRMLIFCVINKGFNKICLLLLETFPRTKTLSPCSSLEHFFSFPYSMFTPIISLKINRGNSKNCLSFCFNAGSVTSCVTFK